MKTVTFIIRSLSMGGAERVVTELSKNLCEKYNVCIITLQKVHEEYTIQEPLKRYNLGLSLKKNRLLDEVNQVKRKLMELDSDIFISFDMLANFYSLMALWKTKDKIIVSERNAPVFKGLSIHSRIIRHILYYRANYFVFQTEGARNFFPSKIQKKSVIIPNPVKSGLPYATRDEKKVIVTIGRLAKQKNQLFLIDAFEELGKRITGYSLRIYGEGPERKRLQKYIDSRNLGDRVCLMGQYKDVHNEIVDADIFALCSIYEGMPNALLEAMAMGIPSVVIDCPPGGMREIIDDGINGFLVPVNDKRGFVDKLFLLAKNHEMANQIGNNAISIRQTHEMSIVAQKWSDIIEGIIEGNIQ